MWKMPKPSVLVQGGCCKFEIVYRNARGLCTPKYKKYIYQKNLS